MRSASPYDVCVIGGAGHVGAPLSIVLASRGVRTIAYDVNESALATLNAGRMPFVEYDAEPLLAEALRSQRLCFTSDVSNVALADVLILTIGTPIDEFHNPRLSVITDCLDGLLPHMRAGQALILRSTIFPGVTNFVDRYLREKGRPMEVSFCPERVVQGFAIRELQSLPQIVSGVTPESQATAARIFGKIAPKIVPMLVGEAEYAKLISNAYRYIQFAAANQFYMMVQGAGLDYSRMLRGLKDDYPRMRDLPGAGFAAGPCLMKDTMQLAAFNNREFILGAAAVTINESLPQFIVEQLRGTMELEGKTVGILGMAFKADVDDTREALSYKLAKILRFHGADVRCSDEFVTDPSFLSAEELLRTSDVVFVGVPHTRYRSLRTPSHATIIDLWDVLPKNA